MNKIERVKKFREIMAKGMVPVDVDHFLHFADTNGFFEAPASASHHAAYEGGLFDHSYQVTESLLFLTKQLGLEWSREQSPYLIGMFHDLCKCDTYRKAPEGADPDHWNYNNSQLLKGHGEKSVIMLQQACRLTEEEILCIRWHMGAFDSQENWNSYGLSISKYPNVLFTHTADMVAARIFGI